MGPRQRLLRAAVVLALLAAYHFSFHALHGMLGQAAFLAGVLPVIVAGALLGVRAAVLTVLFVAGIDRHNAMAMSPDPQGGRLAGALAFSVKLLAGVGVGFLRKMVLRLRTANEQLAAEVAVRQNLARSLRQSDELHRSLLDSMGEGVGLFDERDRFLFANRAAERLLGAPPLGLIGVELTELLEPESRPELERARARAAAAEAPISFDIRLAPNARVVMVTETELQSDAAGGARRLRVLRDLTERARLEREQRELDVQLQRTQALQSLAVLAGGVAHDFNNLLGGVVGNAELALLKLGPTAPPDVRTSLEEIKSFSRQATDLSRQMLAYAGKRALTLEHVDVGDEVDEVLKLMHSGIAARASLELRRSPGLPAVRADRVQIRQVVMNLVMNSLEAMEGGRGRLTVTVQQVAGSAAGSPNAAEGYVELIIADSGAGMSDETRARIFEPFFSTKFTGRGMGLAATQGIVKAHHGHIHVESAVGVGSTFRVLLPAVTAPAARVAASLPPPALSAEGRTVLLVDDELAVRSVTSRMLKELGFGVVIADDGDRAVEFVRERPSDVDVVLLDLTMPRMSGGEALSELRRIAPELRVVLTSGFHAADAGDLVRAPGVRGFLPKPHTLSGLKKALHTALEG